MIYNLKKYGLIGYPLAHSISPFIHNKLFDLMAINAEYTLYEVENFKNNAFGELKESLDGFNVTIPYKKSVIDYLCHLDNNALQYQAVNTVAIENQTAIGYNTDINGLLETIRLLDVESADRILILGAGGVAQMVAVEMARQSKNISVAVRRKSLDRAKHFANTVYENTGNSVKSVDINKIDERYDLLINCTPVGMYPNINKSPVCQDTVSRCGAVIDLIYNPNTTKLMKYARKEKKPCVGGMPMLVYQAAKAQEIWNSSYKFSSKSLNDIIKQGKAFVKHSFNNTKKIFVCIGFMAAGKTTFSKGMTENMKLSFIDIDEEITRRIGQSIPEIFKAKGEEYFRELEKEILSEYLTKENIVISTGGGAAIYNKDLLMSSNALIVYIDTPFEKCYKRIKLHDERPIATRMTKLALQKLYEERMHIYNQVADIIIDGTMELNQQLITLKGFN